MAKPDILIVGGGLAGLFCALKLAPLRVAVLAAAPLGEGSSSAWAQGGVAAAIAEGDSPELHARDTVGAGAGIVDEAVALAVAREAGARVDDLLRFGAPFDRDAEGRLAPSREAAHSARRIVRVKGDGAGAAIMQALIAQVRRAPSIIVHENVVAEDLIVQSGRVAGVYARDASGALHAFPARATVLASGGIGGLYAVTTNPPEVTGAPLAFAAMAGARVADAEFVQFHPTAIDIGRDPAPLATEALRGEGAIADRCRRRAASCPTIHTDAELAPRDVVARGVFAEIAARARRLSRRHASRRRALSPNEFPDVFAACLAAGIDPSPPADPGRPGRALPHGRDRGPTAMAAPRCPACGRRASRLDRRAWGQSPRLQFPARSRGLRRPRRPRDVAAALPDLPAPRPAPVIDRPARPDPEAAAALRRIMTRHVGVLRDESGLREALGALCRLRDRAIAENSIDLRNRAEAAVLIAAGAYLRRESRGGHFRKDFPASDPALARRSFITLDQALRVARRAVAPEAA